MIHLARLAAFDPSHADLVSSWGRGPAEVLNWCSRTEAPVPPADIIAWSEEPETTAFVLGEGDVVLGYGELWIDEAEAEVELARLIIDPTARGRGCGRRLTTELTARALTHYPRVTMRVNPGNHAALRCHESAGFCRVDPATETEWNTGRPTAYQWLIHHTAPTS